ncbi:MAG: energy-coupling factor transporter transmembrane component T [Anaerolineae bacterium]
MPGGRYHTLAWLLWLLGAASLALLNRQPLLQVLLCLAVGAVFRTCAPPSEVRQGWSAFLRLGFFAWAIALVFNLLSVHAGRYVLFRLPAAWPLVGGPITLEALLYGLASGASLFAVLLVFATFNTVVDMHRLLRWVPAGLAGAGLVVSIAITFVPQLLTAWQEIRDAQRVRGHRVQGLRALVPLVVPLLTMALERSLILAESMEARGFGGTALPISGWARGAISALTLLGLALALGGLTLQALHLDAGPWGWFAVAAGLGMALGAVVWQGKASHRSRYARERWGPADTWVAAASALSLAIFVVRRLTLPAAFLYYPYPPYTPWPTFDPLAGLGAVLLAAPALMVGARGEEEAP